MSKPISLQTLLHKNCASISIYEKILVASRMHWANIIGKNLSKMTFPFSFVKGVLLIHTDNPDWLSELELQKKQIQKNIIVELSMYPVEKVLYRLRFSIGKLDETENDPLIQNENFILKLSPSDEKMIEDLLKDEKDEKLKNALKHYFSQMMMKKVPRK